MSGCFLFSSGDGFTSTLPGSGLSFVFSSDLPPLQAARESSMMAVSRRAKIFFMNNQSPFVFSSSTRFWPNLYFSTI